MRLSWAAAVRTTAGIVHRESPLVYVGKRTVVRDDRTIAVAIHDMHRLAFEHVDVLRKDERLGALCGDSVGRNNEDVL